jgi:hypothetical protein
MLETWGKYRPDGWDDLFILQAIASKQVQDASRARPAQYLEYRQTVLLMNP